MFLATPWSRARMNVSLTMSLCSVSRAGIPTLLISCKGELARNPLQIKLLWWVTRFLTKGGFNSLTQSWLAHFLRLSLFGLTKINLLATLSSLVKLCNMLLTTMVLVDLMQEWMSPSPCLSQSCLSCKYVTLLISCKREGMLLYSSHSRVNVSLSQGSSFNGLLCATALQWPSTPGATHNP